MPVQRRLHIMDETGCSLTKGVETVCKSLSADFEPDVRPLTLSAANDQYLRAEKLQARLLLQVHDELIVECPAAEAETVKAILVDEMEHVVDYRVPLLVDAKIGASWAEAH